MCRSQGLTRRADGDVLQIVFCDFTHCANNRQLIGLKLWEHAKKAVKALVIGMGKRSLSSLPLFGILGIVILVNAVFKPLL